AEDGIRDYKVTGVQTCALPILAHPTLLEELAAFRKPELLQALRAGAPATPIQDIRFRVGPIDQPAAPEPERNLSQPRTTLPPGRSEERRVGKEGRCGGPVCDCR